MAVVTRKKSEDGEERQMGSMRIDRQGKEKAHGLARAKMRSLGRTGIKQNQEMLSTKDCTLMKALSLFSVERRWRSRVVSKARPRKANV